MIKDNFFKWIYKKPSFWIIVGISLLIRNFSSFKKIGEDLQSMTPEIGFGKIVGDILFEIIFVGIFYFIYWLIKKNKNIKNESPQKEGKK